MSTTGKPPRGKAPRKASAPRSDAAPRKKSRSPGVETRRPARRMGPGPGKSGSVTKASSSKSDDAVVLYAPKRTSRATGPLDVLKQRRPDNTAGLPQAQLTDIFRLLHETRRLEEHLVALYRQGQVIGGVYRSLGQEATAVGCTYAMRDGDYVQPLIRDLGALLVHGASPLSILRQYMARSTGPSGGRDLNTHFSDPNVGILGPVSMLGAMIPVLAGCLLAARMKGENKAGLAFIGDGGSSTGAFYEGLNFAAVKRLPMVMVIEANHYAYSTATANQLPDGNILRRARGFGCYVAHVDGNDVLACYEATRDARARALASEGPTIIVSDTYRRKGHAEHDAQKYVDEKEPALWQEHNDPMDRYCDWLGEGGWASATDLQAIRKTVDAELDVARDQATKENFPDPVTQEQGVYADGTSPWPDSSTWFRGGPALREALGQSTSTSTTTSTSKSTANPTSGDEVLS